MGKSEINGVWGLKIFRNELGVEQQIVNKSEIHDLEPHIKPFYHAGVYYPYANFK